MSHLEEFEIFKIVQCINKLDVSYGSNEGPNTYGRLLTQMDLKWWSSTLWRRIKLYLKDSTAPVPQHWKWKSENYLHINSILSDVSTILNYLKLLTYPKVLVVGFVLSLVKIGTSTEGIWEMISTPRCHCYEEWVNQRNGDFERSKGFIHIHSLT